MTNVYPNSPGEPGWWDTEVGKHYWRANIIALQRGVKITRIFIYSDMTDALAGVIKTQGDAGVNVGLVKHRNLDASLHLNFAIWDGKKAWEARMNAKGEIVENLFSVNRNDIDRLSRAFRNCSIHEE